MAKKTVREIKKSITDVFINDDAVKAKYGLTPGKSFEDEFSAASIESIIFHAVAFGMFVLYSFFELFKAEINAAIINYTHPTLIWFAEKVKTFQYGDDVVPEKDYYDNTGLTDEEIALRKVVKYAAAVEQSFSNGRFGVRVKVAGEDGAGERIELPTVQLNALKSFFFLPQVKPAGVYVEITSSDADRLKLDLRVYYNPRVLNGLGQRLDGTDNRPLQNAIDAFLKNLPFNGRFNLTKFQDAMQAVDGISDPRILSAQTRYAALPYTMVVDEIVPDSAYLKIYDEADLTIEWIAKDV